MKFLNKAKKYNFELKHIAILFTLLITFEIIMFFIFKSALSSFIIGTQEWYQEYSSSRIANYTANSFEMLIETLLLDEEVTPTEKTKMIQKFDILLNQQSIEKDIEEICLFVLVNNQFKIVDDGEVLFEVLIERKNNIPKPQYDYSKVESLFLDVKEEILSTQTIKTIFSDDQEFYSFIPFLPNGELNGVMFVKSTPNFSSITQEFIYNYDIIAFIFSILILTGLFLMYIISSNTVTTRDKAQKELFQEKNDHLKEKINHEKEFVFTKRIYHAHHKAEKVIGFINQDLSKLKGNLEIVNRLTKYSNFISRIIYDMKWYEPQISTIRNSIFNTNVNEVIKFLIDNMFLRLSIGTTAFKIETKFDDKFPIVRVNEFVIWEVLEPIIQNSLTHNSEQNILITISTKYNPEEGIGFIFIEDNGKGISEELLIDNNGVKKIFLENTSSKGGVNKNFGYGCFIAYNMAKKCGWELDAENLPQNGCMFTITIKF